jgi:hypothetical protein
MERAWQPPAGARGDENCSASQPVGGTPRSKNVKFTISLSPKSAETLDELKKLTDASTDSEVFRNALRLHLTLLRAQLDGKQLLIRDEKTGDSMLPVTLFSPA